MAVTQAELDGFHEFASQRISAGHSELSFDELVLEWESVRDRDDINAAIRDGLADMEAGRHRPACEAMEELRQKHGISSE